MATGRDLLLERARAMVRRLTADELARALTGDAPPLVVDVREADEVVAGRIAQAVAIPRGLLELRIEDRAEPDTRVVVCCASGTRSLLAARTLLDMGFRDVASLEGGIEGWKAAGLPLEVPVGLGPEARRRYARHLTLAEVGEEGQLRLGRARVLVVGAGGLGSPAALYLAAAGVGTIGLVDDDVVDLTNLQRQILHRTQDTGLPKVESGRRALADLNPGVRVETWRARFDPSNAEALLAPGWDVVVDGTDQISARYTINDACVAARVPVVHAAIHRFEAQVSVFAPERGGPCYRCLFPAPPPPAAVPSCAEAGVIGALPGVVGALQAMQALELVLGIGRPLVGRLLRLDALDSSFEAITLARDPECPACGGSRTNLPHG